MRSSSSRATLLGSPRALGPKSGKFRSLSAKTPFGSYRAAFVRLPPAQSASASASAVGTSASHCAMKEVKATAAWVAARSAHVVVDSSGKKRKTPSPSPSLNGRRRRLAFSSRFSVSERRMRRRQTCGNRSQKWGVHDSRKLSMKFKPQYPKLNGIMKEFIILIMGHSRFNKDLNYDNLALGLKVALENDKSAFDADRLQTYTGPKLRKMLNWPRPLPLEEERIRLLHEVGLELERSFGGKASNLVEACGKSAVSLVTLITRHFPGFRDHSLYKGHQIFLYKRAQIFAADLWGAFKGQGYGNFHDISSLTIFADYIVPAVLQQLGVLKYSSILRSTIDADDEIGAGSEQEIEIRACTIYAVEKMKDLIKKKTGKQVLSIELDLWLWSVGVQCPSLQHHRTLSIYY
ncbi:hypothetical protein ACLOJK_003622 [Asimina triloba]